MLRNINYNFINGGSGYLGTFAGSSTVDMSTATYNNNPFPLINLFNGTIKNLNQSIIYNTSNIVNGQTITFDFTDTLVNMINNRCKTFYVYMLTDQNSIGTHSIGCTKGNLTINLEP